MDKVKTVHIADVHIGAECSYLGRLSEQRRSEVVTTFGRVLEYCEAEKVDLLLIAGDLFESNAVNPQIPKAVFTALSKLSHTKVVFAAGNHDPLTADSPFLTEKLPENLYVLPTEDGFFDFPELNARVYGRSFAGVYDKGRERFSIPADENRINIMVMHGEYKNPLSNYCPISREFMAESGMDYVALGHIHEKSEIEREGETFFAYSGCVEGQGFDETGVKGIYTGEIGKGTADLVFKPLFRRVHRIVEADVSDCVTSEDAAKKVFELLKQFGDAFREDIYKIVLTGEVTPGTMIKPATVNAKLSEELFFVKTVCAFRDKTDYATLAKQNSLKGIFTRLMMEKAESAVSEQEKEKIMRALKLGLKSFDGEVEYDED